MCTCRMVKGFTTVKKFKKKFYPPNDKREVWSLREDTERKRVVGTPWVLGFGILCSHVTLGDTRENLYP